MDIANIDIRKFFHNYDENNDSLTFNERLMAVLEKQRAEINNLINNYAERLKFIVNINILQSDIISLRQRLLENNHIVLDKITILNYNLIKLKANELTRLNTSHQVRFQNAEERNMVVTSNDTIAQLSQRIEILTNFSIYLKDTMNELDSMKYAVRNVIDINGMLGAVPK